MFVFLKYLQDPSDEPYFFPDDSYYFLGNNTFYFANGSSTVLASASGTPKASSAGPDASVIIPGASSLPAVTTGAGTVASTAGPLLGTRSGSEATTTPTSTAKQVSGTGNGRTLSVNWAAGVVAEAGVLLLGFLELLG